jgi:hypothetical protein
VNDDMHDFTARENCHLEGYRDELEEEVHPRPLVRFSNLRFPLAAVGSTACWIWWFFVLLCGGLSGAWSFDAWVYWVTGPAAFALQVFFCVVMENECENCVENECGCKKAKRYVH